MCKIGTKTLMAVFLFGSVTMALDKTEHCLAGKVKKVDAEAHKILIQAESGTETLPFTDNTTLIGLRPDSKVKDVLPGDSIIVLYSEKGRHKQAQEIKNIKLSHKIEMFDGNIIQVYRFTRLMFIKMSDGKEEVFQIAENAILISNGQLVSLAELAAEQGERVRVYYTTDLGLKTVQAMEGQHR